MKTPLRPWCEACGRSDPCGLDVCPNRLRASDLEAQRAYERVISGADEKARDRLVDGLKRSQS